MRYRTRHAEAKLRQLAAHFRVVLVTGARQVGKSTLLTHVFPTTKVVVFDRVQDLYGARADPDLFLDSFPGPAILDEIQSRPRPPAGQGGRPLFQELRQRESGGRTGSSPSPAPRPEQGTEHEDEDDGKDEPQDPGADSCAAAFLDTGTGGG